MPVLPLIDLMLLSGWTSLLVGFVLKVISLTTSYRPTLLGLSPIDFALIAVVAMLFAIALAARTWVKTQEPLAVAVRRRDETMQAWNALQHGDNGANGNGGALTPDEVIKAAASAESAARRSS
jgi:hypothetical protein